MTLDYDLIVDVLCKTERCIHPEEVQLSQLEILKMYAELKSHNDFGMAAHLAKVKWLKEYIEANK